MEPFKWGPAEAAYGDWKGNAQLDEKITGEDSVYTVTGVDENKWTIIGLDIGGGESGMHNPRVVVVPADANLDASPIEARLLQIHDVDPFEILRTMMNLFDMRLRTRRFENVDILITGYGDIPEQE